jgi:hypothetical protein
LEIVQEIVKHKHFIPILLESGGIGLIQEGKVKISYDVYKILDETTKTKLLEAKFQYLQ